jgi:diadenosine tetraphosphate (Ap4A) HIT family hydrolase
MCADGHLPRNEHGDLLAELPGSYARLHRNQTHAGYTVVILNRQVAELHDLPPDELCRFWNDVAAVGRTITALFAPAKLDYLVMGHLCPHIHCHVYPQYGGDDPHALINVQDGEVRLDDQAWEARVNTMREHLASQYR